MQSNENKEGIIDSGGSIILLTGCIIIGGFGAYALFSSLWHYVNIGSHWNMEKEASMRDCQANCVNKN